MVHFMKKAILYFAISTFLSTTVALAGTDQINKDYYIRGDIGQSWAKKLDKNDTYINDKLKKSNIYSIGAGKYFTENLRADIDLSFRNYKLNDNIDGTTRTEKIKSTTLMVNGYYDIYNFGPITPYISAGIGIARNKAGTLNVNNPTLAVNTSYNSKTINNFAWQIGAGASIKATEQVDFDLDYKFINMGKIQPGQGVAVDYSDNSSSSAEPGKSKLRAHEVTIGARYNF
jgi:opacity protein-like surface antigen